MQTQRNELNFEGQNIYVGLDVQLKSWTICIVRLVLCYWVYYLI